MITILCSIQLHVTFVAAKCAGRGWQDNKETDPNDGGKIAIIGNFESAEECALRVYLEHPEAVGATWWTESAFTCEAIYGTKKLTDLHSTNTHNVQTCIFEGKYWKIEYITKITHGF